MEYKDWISTTMKSDTMKTENQLIHMLWNVAYASVKCNKNTIRIANHIHPLRAMLKDIEWRGYAPIDEQATINNIYNDFKEHHFWNWSVSVEFKN